MTESIEIEPINMRALLDEGGAASAALELIQEAVVLLDAASRRVLWANGAAKSLWPQESLQERSWNELGKLDDATIEDGAIIVNRAGDQLVKLRLKSVSLHWRGQALILVVLHEEPVLGGATDPLTQMPNRVALERRLKLLGESRRSGGWALVFVDLDDFKRVNDRWGHTAGDKVLIEVGRRMRSVVREQDLLVRWGGDEFVVLAQWRGDEEDAARLAQRVQSALANSFLLERERQHFQLSASIGVALTHEVLDGSVLFDAADAAMFQSKSKHPGGFEIVHVDGESGSKRVAQVE